jgi:hypothetical protein
LRRFSIRISCPFFSPLPSSSLSSTFLRLSFVLQFSSHLITHKRGDEKKREQRRGDKKRKVGRREERRGGRKEERRGERKEERS